MSKYNKETKIWEGQHVPYSYPKNFMLGDLIYEKLEETPDKVIQICADDDSKLTCGDLKIESTRVAQNLLKIGIKSNDVIGLITHQSHFTTFLINGAIFIGALINPLDESLDEKDIRAVFSDTKPKLIICDENAIEKVERSLKEVNFTFIIYSTDDNSKYKSACDFLKPTNEEEIFKPLRFSEPSDEKIVCIMCTSGTTGSPKGACVTHEFFLSQPFMSVNARLACLSPLYWSTGFYPNLMHVFYPNSIRVFTKERFSINAIIELVEKYQISHLISATSILATLLNSQEFISSKNQSLKNFSVGGAIVPNFIRQKFKEIFPDRNLIIVFGMTELGKVAATKSNEYLIDGAVGSMALSNGFLKIIDENGNALENGEIGEVCGRNKSRFLGYYGNETATKTSLDNEGFLKTGDMGYFNSSGILCLIDRKKEILKYCGFHVNPSEIENLIQSLNGVEMVCVVGIPDLHQTNLITAAIVKRENSLLTESEVVEFVKSKNPSYKQLHGGAYFFKELPMTPSGKILKRVAREVIIKIKIKE